MAFVSMKWGGCRGVTLVELLTTLVIAGLTGVMILPVCLAFQGNGLAEMGRNDLHDRAERLLRFLTNDIREAAFQCGPQPRQADGNALTLVHDSLAGDPLETLPFALSPENGGSTEHDALTMVKAISFIPPLTTWLAADCDTTELTLSRAPNQQPASSREIKPAPEAISHLTLANHSLCYPVVTSDQTLHLEFPLAMAVPVGTEVLGIRAFRYLVEDHGGTGRLRRDDFTSQEILDDAVDGLQFEYLLADGRLVDDPTQSGEIRGVRISLLVRALRPEPNHRDNLCYQLADRSYGPFNDNFRRVLVSQVAEVRNNGL
ncbi:MAG: hypothetical protein C0614_07045 [Desulfuromonas sp.]|nr:MAG: hypothetical protein C0614_07045 [Desulfuromonas sp.]